MRKRISACLAAVAMLFCSAGVSSAADPNIQLLPGWQGSESAHEEITQVSYSSLAETSLVEAEGCASCGGGSSCGGGCDMGGSCGGCCDCCPSGTWNFRGELLFLQPYSSNPGGVGRFGLDFSPRFTLGYTLDSGLGIRGRYWFFDHSAPNNGGNQRLEAHTVDLEVTQTFDVCNFQCLGFLGARRVYFKDGIPGNANLRLQQFVEDEFTGYGITGGIEVVRPLTEKLSLYGTGRASILMGQQEYSVNNALVGTYSRATRSIYELAGGGQWQTELDNGVLVTARGGFEVQSWSEFDQVFLVHGGDIGFAGFVSSLQFTY